MGGVAAEERSDVPYQGRIAGAYYGIRSSTVMSGSMP